MVALMSTYIAKPYLNNNKDLKEFSSSKAAVEYLNSYLTDDMPIMVKEDYMLIGKLIKK